MLKVNDYGPIKQLLMSRVVNGQPLYWVAAYLVDGLLIDSGCHHTAGELVQYLSSFPITQIVHTHHHEDHIGGDYLLLQEKMLPVYAHRDAIPLMKQVPSLYPYQELVWGYPHPVDALELGSAMQTPHFSFRVCRTPGHCAGHVALLEEEQGWCFSGDLFVSATPKVLRPEENVAEIMASLQRLLHTTGSDFTLFTSLGPVLPQGRQSLESLLEYLQSKVQQIRNYAQQGWSVEEMRDTIFGGESRMASVTNGQFSVDHLIQSALRAHSS